MDKLPDKFAVLDTLRRSLDKLPFGVATLDRDRNLIFANAKLLEMAQLPRARMAVKELCDFVKRVNPAVLDVARNALDEAEKTGFFDHTIRTSKGRVLDCTFTKVVDEDGRHIGFLITLLDVTDRMQFERRRQLLLRQELVERFSSEIFHKLNNELMLVMADISILHRRLPEGLSTELSGYVRDIEDHILSASEILQALSLFVRSPRQPPRRFDIVALLRRVCKAWRNMLPPSVEMEEGFPEGAVMVEGFPSLLEKLFENVLQNASRALGGKGRIVVKAHVVSPDAFFLGRYPELSQKPHVVVIFSDNGVGIPFELQERVFEPFFSGWDPPSRGLGLAVALSIARHHGGTIDIQSAPGVGTTITVILPADVTAQALPETSYPEGRGERVLVIEDEDAMRSAVSRMLATLGYEPILARNGAEGIELLKTQKPDVVLLDMVLPDIPGEEVFDRIAELAPGCPVIVMSGYTYIEPVEHVVERGAADLLQKPFTLARLANSIQSALRRKTA